MLSFKGHFDGTTIVLDEPVTLAVGQAVRVVVEPASDPAAPPRQPRFGFGKDKFKIIIRDDFDEPLDEFAEYR